MAGLARAVGLVFSHVVMNKRVLFKGQPPSPGHRYSTMSQTPEAQAFIQRVLDAPKTPGTSLDPILQPSLDDESELRRLFATDKTNPRLQDPYVGLVDAFAAPAEIRTTRARVVADDDDLQCQDGSPSMVVDLEEFKKNWGVFSEAKASKRSLRKYYHSAAYPTSDIDLFLWGMTPEQAEAKIVQIYEAVRDSVPWDVTCVRTKHTISIHSQYPYRSVQIVLRLYSSPAEILAGFDIDAPCVLYNGSRVYANPRALVAMMRQCNTVDMSRRSPSYEVRLAKYKRSPDSDTRFTFLESRRTLRGRPNPLSRYNRRNKRKYKGDLKADTSLSGMEMNDYDVASLHIPYGPGWDARRIDKLVYQTDLGMNSTFNPKNKGRRLHRHPAFFGTIEECIEDCCENCPQPIDDDERKLQADEADVYIQGRIAFIREDPGRQSISGSFNPIDVGEWSSLVYIGPTEKFFTAIAGGDRAGVAQLIKDGHDVNRRDHVGRMPLHVAIFCRQAEIACDLVDAGARMTSRLVDGRTSLHLAAQMDLLVVVKKLLERSAVNKEKAGKIGSDEDEKKDEGVVDPQRERMSSEDDWTSEEDDMAMSDEDADSEGSEDAKPQKTATKAPEAPADQNAGDLPEELDVPDVFDVNLTDWDLTYSPLAYAIVFGSLPVVQVLLDAGADAKSPLQAKGSNTAVLPLTLTIIGDDDERTCKIAERLIAEGASCSAMETTGEARTLFSRAVEANRANLVATFLRCDPNAQTALNFPQVGWNGATTPLVTAVSLNNYSTVAAMIAHGVKFDLSQEEVERAFADSKRYNYVPDKRNNSTIEAALLRHDDIIRLLTELGAEINTGVRQAMQQNSRPESRRTYLDWVRYAIKWAEDRIAEFEAQINPPAASTASPASAESLSGWAKYLRDYLAETKRKQAQINPTQQRPTHQEQNRDKWIGVKGYLCDTEKFLVEHGAKTWVEVFPDQVTTASEPQAVSFGTQSTALKGPTGPKYYAMSGGWNQNAVPSFLESLYDELFEACYAGNNDRIQELCLPAKTPAKDASPLQIAVSVADESANQYIRTGLTPLFAAIAGQHWDTARLIVTVAAAQYKAPEEKRRFTMDIDLDEDSDNESDGSDYDSDGTVEQDAIDFVDIAKRPSSVQCNASPKDLLQAGNGNVDPFTMAIMKDDYELFINTFRLYKHSPIHAQLPTTLLSSIISYDRPEMLDEFIRRTGLGIKIEAAKVAGEELPPVMNDKNKVYLGLNVHGKKRLDLAKRNDPDAANVAETFEAPLVWRAISSGSMKVLDYLLSGRPLEAYQYYAATTNSDTSRLLKRTPDLEKVLPELLGLTITPLGESPLTAALVSKKLETAKYLFEKVPKLMSSAIGERVKFLGVNPVMIAVQLNCDKELVEFLLARDISPADRDLNRGWNIFHYLCYASNAIGTIGLSHELLKYFLKKLPRDVVEALLAQQSYVRLNTPLHVAVQRGNLPVVKILLDFSKATVLVRNVAGSIPLHSAVRPGFPEIIKLLVEAAPEGLHMENGVGETPLEMAGLQNIVSRNQVIQRSFGMHTELNNPVDTPPRIDIDKLEVELPRLRAMLDGLVSNGLLKNGTKTHEKLFAFGAYMEEKLAEAKAAQAAKKPAVSTGLETTAKSSKTLRVVQDAIATYSGKRQLVHLLDVQSSVQDSLARTRPEVDRIGQLAGSGNHNYYHRRSYRQIQRQKDEEGLDAEEDPDAYHLRNSFIFKHLLTGPDTL
ncbi:ankyrin repeat protein [Mycena amicta]|nr:ankyrin repeat protein [Mycena amicta]